VRDALGATLPPGIPEVFLAPVPEPLISLVARWARGHGPFSAGAPAARFGVPVAAALRALVAAGKLHRLGERTCDADVLKLIRRRTLARLRNEVAPVETKVLARFLPRWQGVLPVGETRPPGRLVHAIVPFEGLALPFSDLERAILPARVPDLQPQKLDELGALGEVVWIGRGALGATDGKIALYRRSQVALLAPPPEVPADLSPVAQKILDHLEQRGASFFAELQSIAGALADDTLAALWELVWAGLVTNDTFQPLRALDRPRPPPGRRGSISAAIAGGRWSAVRKLLASPASDTERLTAQAQALLERYGIVTREVGELGTFGPVFRAMEEAGKIRRGYFVEGLGGVQYAHGGAVDRLRAERSDAEGPLLVLAATDPANPYGVLLSWPDPALRRIAGARVVLAGGQVVFYIEPGGRRLRILEPDLVAAAAPGLDLLARRQRQRRLRIDRVNGEPALRSPFADALERAGFRVEPGGLVLEGA
jgi:ATP-dependent Lhr-like helicase